MAFADYLSRVFGRKPIWLYRIEIGAQTFHLVSRAWDITTGPNKPNTDFPTGQTFTSTVIRRGDIIETSRANRSDTYVALPNRSPAMQAALDDDGVSEIKVTIWQGYTGDPDEEYLTRFIGRVVSLEPTFIMSTLNCEADLTQMARSSVAQIMQRPCRHAHYFTNADGGGCGLTLADHQQTAPVTVADGRDVTVPMAALQPDGAFLAGVFEHNGIEYMIENHVGSTLTLEAVPVGLADEIAANDALVIPLPTNILIAEGCNLTSENCLAFGNIENFGGFRWMLDSAFDGRSIA